MCVEKLAKGEAEVRTAEDEEKDVHDGKTEKEEDTKEQEYLTDITENMDEKLKVPPYKYCRQNQILIGMDVRQTCVKNSIYCTFTHILIILYVCIHALHSGKSMVKEVQGYYCERCRRFMLLDEDMNAHLRSITHYRNFVAEVKSLTANTSEKDNDQTIDKVK